LIKEQTAMPALASSEPYPRVGRAEDHEFMTMSRVFGEHGGMVTADELVHCMRTILPQPLSIVGRWIAERAAGAVRVAIADLVSLLPVRRELRRRFVLPCPRVVLELRDAYDDWELALWFASRNEWLDHASPVEMIRRDAAAAVQAARIDRFVARG
jgi:hypothetical protein